MYTGDKIPVFAGPRVVDFIPRSCLRRRYSGAPNARFIRQRKTGLIVEIQLESFSDDTSMPSHPGGQVLTYEEVIGAERPFLTLKVFDEDLRAFRHWSDKDGFDPRRFNPDSVPSTRLGTKRTLT